MAKKTSDTEVTSGKTYDKSVRKWTTPSRRAEGYAKDRREKVHTYGPKKGEELSEYDKGLRSGYLLCQSDHAGQYIYSKARSEGKSKEEATRLSRIKGLFSRKNREDKK